MSFDVDVVVFVGFDVVVDVVVVVFVVLVVVVVVEVVVDVVGEVVFKAGFASRRFCRVSSSGAGTCAFSGSGRTSEAFHCCCC